MHIILQNIPLKCSAASGYGRSKDISITLIKTKNDCYCIQITTGSFFIDTLKKLDKIKSKFKKYLFNQKKKNVVLSFQKIVKKDISC